MKVKNNLTCIGQKLKVCSGGPLSIHSSLRSGLQLWLLIYLRMTKSIYKTQHVEQLDLNDSPALVVIQVYITNAYRAYSIADHYRAQGAYVILGGLHVTSLPEEAELHADSIFIGPGEDTFPQFLKDFKSGNPKKRYTSTLRSLAGIPPIRRDLIKRHLYLVPNSIVVTRGCPHHCSFLL
jgi:hypothetical protein